MAVWPNLRPFGIFCGHLVYFVAIWYILWSFGTFCGHLVYFSPFWYVVPKKIWQPCIGWNPSFLSHPSQQESQVLRQVNFLGNPPFFFTYLAPASRAGLPDGLFSNQKSKFG
jgi:hypothetical protein